MRAACCRGGLAIGVVLACAVTPGSPATAVAAPSSEVAAAVDAIRNGSGCGAFQSDPVVQRTADLALRESSDYKNFRAATVPFDDPIPALKTAGFTGDKAILLSGFGADDASALRGALLQGHAAFLDCSYSLYGVSAARDESGSLVSIVLAGP